MVPLPAMSDHNTSISASSKERLKPIPPFVAVAQMVKIRLELSFLSRSYEFQIGMQPPFYRKIGIRIRDKHKSPLIDRYDLQIIKCISREAPIASQELGHNSTINPLSCPVDAAAQKSLHFVVRVFDISKENEMVVPNIKS